MLGKIKNERIYNSFMRAKDIKDMIGQIDEVCDDCTKGVFLYACKESGFDDILETLEDLIEQDKKLEKNFDEICIEYCNDNELFHKFEKEFEENKKNIDDEFYKIIFDEVQKYKKEDE